jgi:hypothetical protein
MPPRRLSVLVSPVHLDLAWHHPQVPLVLFLRMAWSHDRRRTTDERATTVLWVSASRDDHAQSVAPAPYAWILWAVSDHR